LDTSILHDKDLSEHFSWAEACITTHRDIPNVIPEALREVIIFTASKMERIRALIQAPITISSWYRCEDLNHALGSKPTSQHIKGEAVDFIAPKYGTPLAVTRKIAAYWDLIKFDQLILEHTWVHISFQSIPGIKPRGQVLTLLSATGKYAEGITDKAGKLI
jgi:zinc D-Ala-D-Ala carboxypeptidase